MIPSEALWKDHLKRVGAYIRAQRRMSRLSQRELAEMANLSDTYMSQLERGLHEPSIRVLRGVARGLGVPAEDLILQAAGLESDDGGITTEEAIRRDPRFNEAQRQALLGVVESYVRDARERVVPRDDD